ncbi:unnamed protein product [Parnassius apollo]|uniref:NADPH:adrenodoxin oxidoreductase, mitochondrial n=1 Tax=Parnassius apollo TaxID=110799 RepID=A0A8S3XFW9_PARAO|nr:unnamed protein product [Parnassius apollo]
MITRLYCSLDNVVPRVCIVGSGPAGFYAAMHLCKKIENVHIDILEKLPVPFGLVRYGVAPDHPEVKNVINQFTKVANKPNVNFYGNIALGKDVGLLQLRQNYDAVLLTYGAEEDKTLGIENEEAYNIVAARNFVGWYNGHPRDKDLKIDLSGTTAAILGQGNVALDVARILLTPIDILRKTDITEHALAALADSKVKELYLVGRRGPLQVAFTIKELREQLNLPNCKTVWREQDFEGVSSVVSNLGRPRKRLTELMLKALSESSKINIMPGDKCFKPLFFRSPNKFLTDNMNHVTGIELTCNRLEGDNLEHQKCIATDEKEVLDCSLVFRSIGYTSVKVDKDIIFDTNGFVTNDKGRVIEDNVSSLAKLYVAGWLGTGPAGVILHTMSNAFLVAKTICEDLKNCKNLSSKGGFEEVRKFLSKSNQNHIIVDWNGWKKIDNYEVELGKKYGKPREKICSISKMLEIASS